MYKIKNFFLLISARISDNHPRKSILFSYFYFRLDLQKPGSTLLSEAFEVQGRSCLFKKN